MNTIWHPPFLSGVPIVVKEEPDDHHPPAVNVEPPADDHGEDESRRISREDVDDGDPTSAGCAQRRRDGGIGERRGGEGCDEEGHEAEESPSHEGAMRARGEASVGCKVCSACPTGRGAFVQGVRRVWNLRARSSALSVQGVRWVSNLRARSSALSVQGVRWVGICVHGRQRFLQGCGGSQICVHGRQRFKCKECGGGSVCEHDRRRSTCKEWRVSNLRARSHSLSVQGVQRIAQLNRHRATRQATQTRPESIIQSRRHHALKFKILPKRRTKCPVESPPRRTPSDATHPMSLFPSASNSSASASAAPCALVGTCSSRRPPRRTRRTRRRARRERAACPLCQSAETSVRRSVPRPAASEPGVVGTNLLVPPAQHPERASKQPQPQRGRLQLLGLHQRATVLRSDAGVASRLSYAACAASGNLPSPRASRRRRRRRLRSHHRRAAAPQPARHQLELQRHVRHRERDVAGKSSAERAAALHAAKSAARSSPPQDEAAGQERVPQAASHGAVGVAVPGKVEHLEAHRACRTAWQSRCTCPTAGGARAELGGEPPSRSASAPPRLARSENVACSLR